MENNKLGHEPAFPGDTLELGPGGEFKYHETGMSKRFYAACAAMQGIVSTLTHGPEIAEYDNEFIAEASYKLADELLKQENQ